jgi:hypothetical protein
VLSGSIAKQGNDYVISVEGHPAVTGEELVSEQVRASGKSAVLPAATQLMGEVRNALGDDASEQARQLKHGVAVGHLARRRCARMRGDGGGVRQQVREALQHALKTIEIDKNFGLGLPDCRQPVRQPRTLR